MADNELKPPFVGQPPHRILDIPADAPLGDIKRAYRRLALKHHPDVEGGSKETFNAVNEAYNKMINGSYGGTSSSAGGGASYPFKRRRNDRAGSGSYGDAGYGSRAAQDGQQFYTPNPYRTRTAQAVRGSQGVQSLRQRVVFDEGLRAAIRSDNQRTLQRHSQKAHNRRNIVACAVPFFMAWGFFEWKHEQKKQELRSKYSRS